MARSKGIRLVIRALGLTILDRGNNLDFKVVRVNGTVGTLRVSKEMTALAKARMIALVRAKMDGATTKALGTMDVLIK